MSSKDVIIPSSRLSSVTSINGLILITYLTVVSSTTVVKTANLNQAVEFETVRFGFVCNNFKLYIEFQIIFTL